MQPTNASLNNDRLFLESLVNVQELVQIEAESFDLKYREELQKTIQQLRKAEATKIALRNSNNSYDTNSIEMRKK